MSSDKHPDSHEFSDTKSLFGNTVRFALDFRNPGFMPSILEWTHTVADADLDGLGHANNISYLKWMQSAALAHSAIQGWPVEAYAELGCGWVVRSHFIEYLSPALPGDTIIVRTWIADMKKATSLRRYRIVTNRTDQELVLAKAQTDWAFIDYRTSLPRRIPPQIITSFEIATLDD